MTQQINLNGSLKQPRDRAGFSLTEIMVVIAIIVILVAISFPVMNRIMESARLNQTQNEVAALATALRAYLNEYSVWPGITAWQNMGTDGLPVDEDVIKLLTGHSDMEDYNRRRIVFMEFPDRALQTGEFRDPWNNETYRFRVNVGYGSSMVVRPQGTNITVRQPVAVWSTGTPDQGLITSW